MIAVSVKLCDYWCIKKCKHILITMTINHILLAVFVHVVLQVQETSDVKMQ